MLTESRRKARAQLASAAAAASRRPEDRDARAAVSVARRDYYAAALEDYIRQTVSTAPELTAEQRERLAQLLRGGGRVA